MFSKRLASYLNSRDNELPNSMFFHNSTKSFRPLKSQDTNISYTQFYKIKGGEVVYPPPPRTITFDRVDEIQKFFMNSSLGQVWSRIHKICKFQKLLVMEGGGGGALHFRFIYSVKLCVMINFNLHHNVLCFSFIAVL